MKIINKSHLPKVVQTNGQPKQSQYVLNEVEVLKNLHHPNIVHLAEVIDDKADDKLYLVMQYLPGSSL